MNREACSGFSVRVFDCMFCCIRGGKGKRLDVFVFRLIIPVNFNPGWKFLAALFSKGEKEGNINQHLVGEALGRVSVTA